MADCASHLVDSVVPEVPIRQWVVTLPWQVRAVVGYDRRLCGAAGSVADIALKVRGHWRIENELHWVLDLAFREDEARHRAKNAAANMATLRHFALGIVKQDATRKVGVANARKRAGFDRAYLIRLMRGADPTST